jgi:uncharacterized membrane protein (DUF4010 family)
MTVVALAATAFLLRRARAQEPAAAGEVVLKNPFSLTSAFKFGLVFAAVLVVMAAVEKYLPSQNYYLVATLAGLTDVDAITLSMAGVARNGIDLAPRRAPWSWPRSRTRSSSAGWWWPPRAPACGGRS